VSERLLRRDRGRADRAAGLGTRALERTALTARGEPCAWPVASEVGRRIFRVACSPDGGIVAGSGTGELVVRGGAAFEVKLGQYESPDCMAFYVKASNIGAFDTFGDKVAISSNASTIAVGAPGEDGGAGGINGTPDESAMNAGACYVFVP
jgi:hypothetical protein